MSGAEDHVQTLLEALAVSPGNMPLRRHLGQLFLKRGMHDEAEQVYREGIDQSPTDPEMKLGLARCFYRQGKASQAMVVVEELLGGATPPAGAHLLLARLLMRDGAIDRAAAAYHRAIDADPGLADDELAEVLGVTDSTDMQDSEDEESEVDEYGRVRMRSEAGNPADSSPVEMEKPKVSFADVGGMDVIKQQIRLKIIEPLKHPEIYQAYGKAIGGGILMYGPPGCGKTHLARATAGEIDAGFVNVGIHDVLDMWIGASEQKLHALFQHARSHAPCVLFFDEVDALGSSRSDMRQSAGKHLINQFLSELDGVASSNEGVLILAATNAPWHLDSAFRRPGRFDRILFVPPPDTPARSEILRVLLRGKPLGEVDCQKLGQKLNEYSGADLKAVIDTAVEAKLTEAMKTGTPTPLTTRDLQSAARSVRPSTREWFSTARNYALYANESGLYDEILEYLKIKR